MLANLIYAINFTFAKDVMPDFIMPSGFILLRVIGGLFLFSLAYFFLIKERIETTDLIRLAICGVFGVAINQLFFFEGLNLTTPINAAIIMTINPLLVILISYLILREIITFKKAAGVFLGLIGASILILNGGGVDFSADHKTGNLFVLINASSYGVYLVLVKPLIIKYHPITVLFYIFLFGLIYVTPFGIDELSAIKWGKIPNDILLEILFVVIFTTFFAYLLNASGLKRLNPTTVSIYIYLQPILATVFALIWGVDSLNNQKIWAAIIIFVGVYLVSINNAKTKTNKLS